MSAKKLQKESNHRHWNEEIQNELDKKKDKKTDIKKAKAEATIMNHIELYNELLKLNLHFDFNC